MMEVISTDYNKLEIILFMQVLHSNFKIEEMRKKDSILKVVSDKYCRTILYSIMIKPKSAIEITMESKIPLSTVYRRIQMLHDNNLVSTSGMITEDGKRLFLYKSMIKGINCNFNNGQVEVELIFNK